MPLLRILLAFLLAIALNACSTPGPLTAAAEQAIALQVEQTQAVLRQQLFRRTAPEPPAVAISHVRITQQEGVKIQGQKGYHIRGTYDVEFDFGDRRVTQRENPFDLYLQRDAESDRWSWAKPTADNGATQWTLQTLPQNR